jgi:hypothetical protein
MRALHKGRDITLITWGAQVRSTNPREEMPVIHQGSKAISHQYNEQTNRFSRFIRNY